MTLQDALKVIREVCEQAAVNKKTHDVIQEALKIVEEKCSETK